MRSTAVLPINFNRLPAGVTEQDVRATAATLTDEQVRELLFCWELWNRREQEWPAGDWHTWLIMAGRGFGKALQLDVDIPTPYGWKTLETLAVGDQVFDEGGQVCNVTFITDVMWNRPCFEVEFDDGTVIVADAEHQWFTWTRAARKAYARRIENPVFQDRPQNRKRPTHEPRVRTTEDLRATLMDCGERNHSIDVCGALDLPAKELPIEPYVLGVWLGDGDSKDNVITTADSEVCELVLAGGTGVDEGKRDSRSRAVRYRIGGEGNRRCPTSGRMLPSGLRAKLKDLGVLRDKHIPAEYLRASAYQRMALLMGLMDTDGSVSLGGACEYTSTDERLARDVHELVLSLGFKATLISGRATIGGRDCGPKWRICFTPHRPVFRLQRKLARQHCGKAQAKRVGRRYIVDIRPCKSVPVRCLTVDSPSHLFLVSRSFIPTHNTRTGAETVRTVVNRAPRQRIALVGPTAGDCRDVMVEGESGLMNVFPPHQRPVFEPSKRRVTFWNGSRAYLYSAEEPERLRGPQSHFAWLDEIATYDKWADIWTNLSFGLRLGRDPRVIATTTPRPVKWMKELIADPGTIVTRGSTFDNRANLPASQLANFERIYGGTRIGRQELEGQLLEESEGALWNRETIERARVRTAPSELVRVVVAIDPATTSGEGSDDTGISAFGVDAAGDGYVLADDTCHLPPAQWAARSVMLFDRLGADRVIGEANNGGDMVELTIRTDRRNIPYEKVHAARGKVARAEPVAALYEQGRIHHVGSFPALEDEMVNFVPGQMKRSPNRVDALVWGASYLMLKPARVGRVLSL